MITPYVVPPINLQYNIYSISQ